MTLPSTVAGIDIGGERKGCHLVILRGSTILCSINSRTPEHLLQKCIEFDATAVGVDSPCQWSADGRGRRAERELAQQGIFSFATPTRGRAMSNTGGFYGWMLNGERVFQAFASAYPLLTARCYSKGQVSFETFPHAITCAMLGKDVASAKQKRFQRRQLLETAGIDTTALKSIDAVDAGLCALTARLLLEGRTNAYGDAVEGYILVPVSAESP